MRYLKPERKTPGRTFICRRPVYRGGPGGGPSEKGRRVKGKHDAVTTFGALEKK